MPSSRNQFPNSILPSLRNLVFACPQCRGNLNPPDEAYHCPGCEKTYPLHGGIPDFRVFPDPYLSFQEDFDRTEIVLDALDRYTLEPLLEYYWSQSDVTPEALRSKFIRSALLAEQKAQRTLRILADDTFQEPVTAERVLEIGSGTGGFLACAGQRYEQVVGVDIAMRWLHVSRRRFLDRELPVPPLVCCCAESLPFPDGVFDLVVATATLEFARDQAKVFSECARVLKAGGVLYLNTVNRFSMASDPYVYLWGVGFLPRAWQARYVRRRRQASYENIRLLSYGELDRLAAPYFATREFALPDVDHAALQQFPLATRLQARVYDVLRTLPVSRHLLKWFGPGWDARFVSKKT